MNINNKRNLLWLLVVLWSACTQKEEFGFEQREGYSIYGMDISKYQQEMDWDKIARDSIKFVFIKASQGKKGKDPYFDQNWEAAKKHGVLRGAYHFFENTDSVETLLQIYNFVTSVSLEEGDLPPVLDIERKPFDKSHLSSVKLYLRAMEFFYQVKPIVYTGEYFYNKYLAGQLDDYPLWIARYDKRKPILKDGRNWLFWQYTSDQRNIFAKRQNKGELDMNAFAGTMEQLQALTKQ